MSGERTMGLFAATALGVGAIVGGGILALAGVAFATAGPAAIVAFGLNGVIALITVTSFASLARRFPESGGTYTFAKKVLSIEVAFVVGWVVWFASIVAGVLYALGFAAFLAEGLGQLAAGQGGPPAWATDGRAELALAVGAIAAYSILLVRKATGGGNVATIGKVVVFAILLAGGIIAWPGAPAGLMSRLDPFAPSGVGGVIGAMGYTFIALQGFDLIAAVGGEVRDPDRNLPRAMFLSLGIALAVYLPLLFLMATVGAPPGGITAAAAANPEALVAGSAQRFMGPTGYWLVIGAGVLSMLSALRANLVGASRVAFAMARDRTLPRPLGQVMGRKGTPAIAVLATAGMVAIIVLAIGDVAAAGAASSLIFLVSFAIVHWTAILARRRSGDLGFPVIPLIGVVLCLGLATFQAVAVQQAGVVVMLWLVLGAALYFTLFAPGARLADATAEARDPDLARLRGRSPLVLVPIANPASAGGLVDLAATVRTPSVGRVLLLSVVDPGVADTDRVLETARSVLGESLERSLARSLVTETLFTVSSDVWGEIGRVATGHDCETVLLGMPGLEDPETVARLENLIRMLDADVLVLRAPSGWNPADARRVLLPTRGRRGHSVLRARMLSSLARTGERTVTYLSAIPEAAPPGTAREYEREIRSLARDETSGSYEVVVRRTDGPADMIVEASSEADLVVLGMQREGRSRRAIGSLPLSIVEHTETPVLLIGRRPSRSLEGSWSFRSK